MICPLCHRARSIGSASGLPRVEAIVRNNLLIAGKNASFANTDHQEKTVNDMIICNSLIAAWLLLLSLTGCLERIHLHHLVDASSQIEIGATEVDVELNR